MVSCSYPISFDMLSHIAFGCGLVLILESLGLLLRRYLLKRSGWVSLTLVAVVLSLISFILALVASRYQLNCGSAQVNQATTQTLAVYQGVIIFVLVISCIHVLIGLGPLLDIFEHAKGR